jgi:hypothetical protein
MMWCGVVWCGVVWAVEAAASWIGASIHIPYLIDSLTISRNQSDVYLTWIQAV